MSEAPSPIRLRYTRSTARYWVYERPGAVAGYHDELIVVHLRQRTGERPDWLDVSIATGRDQPQVIGGRWVEEDDA